MISKHIAELFYLNSYLIEVYKNVDFSLLLALLICQISKSIV